MNNSGMAKCWKWFHLLHVYYEKPYCDNLNHLDLQVKIKQYLTIITILADFGRFAEKITLEWLL
jgi:hypothetical protein